MEEFPSNRQRSGRQNDKPPVQKKVERVVQSEVTRRKKPLGRRLAETFAGGDARGVWGYVTFDVLIPAAKDAIADAFTQGIERMLFPDSNPRSRGRRRPGGGSYVSYDRYSQRDRRDDPRSISRRARASHDFDEIILATRVEAEEVIDQLYEIISKYEIVSVADLYNMVGITGNFTDEKWGWDDLRGAGVTRLRNGEYLLDLPKPQPLD